jgi:hypothetical protein
MRESKLRAHALVLIDQIVDLKWCLSSYRRDCTSTETGMEVQPAHASGSSRGLPGPSTFPTKVLPSSQRSSPCATADKTPLCPDAVAAGAPYNRVLGNGTVYGKNFILAPPVPPAGIPQTQAIRKPLAQHKKGAPVRRSALFVYRRDSYGAALSAGGNQQQSHTPASAPFRSHRETGQSLHS